MAETPKLNNLEDLLKPVIKNNQILDYQTKLLTASGENYGSIILAVEIRIKDDKNSTSTLNIIAKLCPTNQWLKKMFAIDITFKKEIQFYLEFVPTLINFQKEQKVPENKLLTIFPECLNARLSLNPSSEEVDDDGVILLENLRLKGYKVLDRLKGFNLEETELVVRDLAKFHAVPLALKLKKPTIFKKLMPLLNQVNIGQEIFETSSDKITEFFLRHLNLNQSELKRFITGMNLGYDYQQNFPIGNEKYATVVHRDFWLTNTMIKHENNKPVSNKMLDFQVNTYGPPASDLLFLLYTSVELPVLIKNYDYFLKIYHQEFIENLRDLKCDITDYTFESFLDEVNYYGPREASHILFMLKTVFKDTIKDNFKIENMSIDDLFSDHGVTEIFKNRLEYTVRNFFDKNWL